MFGQTSMKTVTAGLLAAVVAMGCEVGDDDLMGPAPQPQPAPTHQPVSVTNAYGPLELTLTADRAVYERYETVRLEIRARNTGHSAITLNFVNGQQHDFLAEAHGGPVWRYSNGRVYSMAINHVTIQPGETWTRLGTWDQRDNAGWEVARGVYGVRGVVMHYARNTPPFATDALPITLR